MLIPVLTIAGIALVFYALQQQSKTTPKAYWLGPKPGYRDRDNTRVRKSTLNRPPVKAPRAYADPRDSQIPYGTGMGIGGTGFWTNPENFNRESRMMQQGFGTGFTLRREISIKDTADNTGMAGTRWGALGALAGRQTTGQAQARRRGRGRGQGCSSCMHYTLHRCTLSSTHKWASLAPRARAAFSGKMSVKSKTE